MNIAVCYIDYFIEVNYSETNNWLDLGLATSSYIFNVRNQNNCKYKKVGKTMLYFKYKLMWVTV